MQPERHSELARLNFQEGSFSTISVDGILRSVSAVFLNATGWNERDWLGKRFSLLLHKGEFVRVEKFYEKALRGNSVELGTIRCVARDGTDIEVDSSFVPRLSDGKVIDILWLSHSSPNERSRHIGVQSSTIVRTKREPLGLPNPLDIQQAGLIGLLQTLLANAPVGIALFDEDLKFICLNQTFSQMTGFSPDQQLGQSLLEVMPRLGVLLEPALRRVLLRGHPVTDHEITLQKFPLSDHSRWGLISYYPVPDGRGGICGAAIIAIDITDRKRAEKALHESEDRLRVAVDATRLGTWDLNFLTGKVTWSERTKAIFGLHPNITASQKLFLERLHRDDYQRVIEAIERAKDPNSGSDYKIEYRIVRASDGAECWISARGRVCFNENGAPVRFVGTLLDVTDQKNAEIALTNLSEELTRSNHALDAFAHTASHDLKEPLRMISMYVKLLSTRYKGKLDADADEYIEFVINGAERMGNLVDSILEYAKTGRTLLKVAKVDCAAIVGTALENLKASLEEGQLDITYDRMPMVLGSAELISQIFQNLIANAIKFRGHENPKIHIGVEAEGAKWIFSVSDNGIGIPSNFIEAIFSPFRRLHSQSDYAGSGLGLAICKQNVERHGGRIWAKSQEGRGSIFYFTLPAIIGGGN